MINAEELSKHLSISDLDYPYNDYAEMIGLQNFIEMCKLYGGISIYIPNTEKLLFNTKRRLIKEDFDGYNYYDLAVKYGYHSTKTIQDIVRDVKGVNKAPHTEKAVKNPKVLNYEKILKKARIEDFKKLYNDYAKVLGMENLYKLCKFTPCIRLYIPQIKTILKPLKNKFIMKEFNGGNYGDLAIKYKLSERYIRYLINGN